MGNYEEVRIRHFNASIDKYLNGETIVPYDVDCLR